MAEEKKQSPVYAYLDSSTEAIKHTAIASSEDSTAAVLSDHNEIDTSSRTSPDDLPLVTRVLPRKPEKLRRQKAPKVWKKILWIKQSCK